MPTYEYECTACGHRFECFQSMMEKPKKRCPECRKKVRRLISGGGGFLFKGGGFYTTDYRSKDYKEKAKAEKDLMTGGSGAKKEKTAKGKAKAPASGPDKKPGKKSKDSS